MGPQARWQRRELERCPYTREPVPRPPPPRTPALPPPTPQRVGRAPEQGPVPAEERTQPGWWDGALRESRGRGRLAGAGFASVGARLRARLCSQRPPLMRAPEPGTLEQVSFLVGNGKFCSLR